MLAVRPLVLRPMALVVLWTVSTAAVGKERQVYGPPSLDPLTMKVGDRGYCHWNVWTFQVLDENQMLVKVRTSDGPIVLVKCKTAGIVDGKFVDFRSTAGFEVARVSGTSTYATAGGATRTVFVVEPLYRGNLSYKWKDIDAADDVATYDKFIAETEREIETVRKAAKIDEDELRGATDPKEKKRLEGSLATYKNHLADLEWAKKDLALWMESGKRYGRVTDKAKEQERIKREGAEAERRLAEAQAKRKADATAREKADAERFAGSILKYARELADAGMTEKAKERLQDLIKRFPHTEAAETAKTLLKKLAK